MSNRFPTLDGDIIEELHMHEKRGVIDENTPLEDKTEKTAESQVKIRDDRYFQRIKSPDLNTLEDSVSKRLADKVKEDTK